MPRPRERATSAITDSKVAVSFDYDTDIPGIGILTLRFRGEMDGETMQGTVDFGRYATGAWDATR